MVTPDFQKLGGLVPVIVQDAETSEVLMLAFMNRHAWERTLETDIAWYFSRSRGQLWMKGETSGHVQRVKAIFFDCDHDTILLKIEQVGGTACHTGSRSCFFSEVRDGEIITDTGRLLGAALADEERPRAPQSGSGVLRVGLPSGSLQEATLQLVRKAGFRVDIGTRSYMPRIDDPELEPMLLRAQEIPKYVEKGVIDIGISGKDWIAETAADVVEIGELRYSKHTSAPVKVVLAVPNDSPVRKAEDLQGKRIAAELVHVTEEYLKKRGVQASVEFSWGSTESKSPRLVDAIVDLTETGSSLKANNLRIVDVILESTPRIIAHRESMKDPWKRAKIEHLVTLLTGALEAGSKVGLKMNVPEGRLPKVLAIVSALRMPTVSPLTEKGWVAVEVVMDELRVKDIISALKAEGVEGIVEYPLNKVIP